MSTEKLTKAQRYALNARDRIDKALDLINGLKFKADGEEYGGEKIPATEFTSSLLCSDEFNDNGALFFAERGSQPVTVRDAQDSKRGRPVVIVVLASNPAVCICGGTGLMRLAEPAQAGNFCIADCLHCRPPYLPIVVVPSRGGESHR
jgi:hypothetical protein